MLYLIGGGGVGAWLAALMPKIEREVTVIDGDTVEEKNLDRQLFEIGDLGKPKAIALSRRFGVAAINQWFTERLTRFSRVDWLICCADNHPCRRSVLRACDTNGCQAIIAANETTCAEAYYYDPKWGGSPLDPRVYYPEIETDTSGDPRAHRIGCTGDAQAANPQLASANFLAAALAAHLHMIWRVKASKVAAEFRQHLPYWISGTLSRMEAKLVKDAITTKGQHERSNTDHS